MHTKTKIEQSFQKITALYENADHLGLGYLNLSEKQRDTICNCSFDIKQCNAIDSMAIAYNSKQNHVDFYYNEYVHDNTDQNIITKIMSHEVGHIHLEQANFGLYKLSKFRLNKIIKNIAYSIPCMVSSPFVAIGSLSIAPVQPLALVANAAAAIFYAARVEEKEADKIADKIMPEVTYQDLRDFHEKRQEEMHKQDFLYNSEMTFRSSDYSCKPIGRLMHLFMPHPSDYSRVKSSDQNCLVYLAEKQRLNIPSLYVAQ